MRLTRRLDGAIAEPKTLPRVVDTDSGRTTVLFDSGLHHGPNELKQGPGTTTVVGEHPMGHLEPGANRTSIGPEPPGTPMRTERDKARLGESDDPHDADLVDARRRAPHPCQILDGTSEANPVE